MRLTVKDNVKFAVALAAQSYAAGANNGTAINCSKAGSVSFHLNAGTFGASATLDAKVQYTDVADASSGWTDAGVAMTQLLAAGAAQSAQLDVLVVAHPWYRIVTTGAVAAVVHGATAALGGNRDLPAGQALV